MLYIWIYPQEAKTSGQHGKEFMNLLLSKSFSWTNWCPSSRTDWPGAFSVNMKIHCHLYKREWERLGGKTPLWWSGLSLRAETWLADVWSRIWLVKWRESSRRHTRVRWVKTCSRSTLCPVKNIQSEVTTSWWWEIIDWKTENVPTGFCLLTVQTCSSSLQYEAV